MRPAEARSRAARCRSPNRLAHQRGAEPPPRGGGRYESPARPTARGEESEVPIRLFRGESYCASERVHRLSLEGRDLLPRLIGRVDDYGLLDARPQFIASCCHPLDPDRERAARALDELDRERLIRRYEVGGRSYLILCQHREWINTKPKYPLPPAAVYAEAEVEWRFRKDREELYAQVAHLVERLPQGNSMQRMETQDSRARASLRPSPSALHPSPIAQEERNPSGSSL